MMKIYRSAAASWRAVALLCGAFALLSSCALQDPQPEMKAQGNAVVVNASSPALVAGMVNVLVSDEMAAALEAASSADGVVDLSKAASLLSPGVLSMRRFFPPAGEFEARTRAAGLHRWYRIEYTSEWSETKASDELDLPGVERIEFVPQICRPDGAEVVSYVSDPAIARSGVTSTFNDPQLGSQWHYYNNGSTQSSASGCDINVIPVWRRFTTGNPDVIVSVVDGGVDYSHEDLAANMWNNPNQTGTSKYGFNFVRNTYAVTPDSHGTHVAGTIAAVNNNGIGVCGIAGGDAANKKKGVKIMSCQIFEGKNSASDAEAAIKWGADHGAVISQNSWSYTTATSTPGVLRAAVNYFIENAGKDADGNQTGPMKGGVVIFSAGNENRDYSSSSYEKIISVASVGADFRRAYYSCYGDWVTIAAPGGDAKKGNEILSTLPGNRYGYMQGTSMSCPHVSGVAALIVSQLGGKSSGFTPEQLRKRMVDNATPLSSFNPNFQLGAGLVNAYRSIAGASGKAPDKPTNLSVSASSNNVSVEVTVPADEDDVVPNAICIYYAKHDFSSTAGLSFAQFYVEDLNVGDVLRGTIHDLEFNTPYWFAAVATDISGNASGLTARVQATTTDNHPPVITALSSPFLTLKAHQTDQTEFSVEDPDGHFYALELEDDSTGAVLDTLVRNKPVVRITGANAPEGTHHATLRVTDIYGLSAEATVTYTILENHPPYVVQEIGDRIFTSRSADALQLYVGDFFRDDDGESLTCEISLEGESVNFTAENGYFYLSPMNYGYTTVKVTVKDVRGETASQTFRALVRNGKTAVEVYPNPVSDVLYIRTGSEKTVTVRIWAASGACVYSYSGRVTPFEPLRADLSAAAPGVYTVVVEGADKEPVKYNIVKI